MVDCPDCNGTGKCPHCMGTGLQGNPPGSLGNRAPCLLCSPHRAGPDDPGTGICAKCEGTGKVTRASLGLPTN